MSELGVLGKLITRTRTRRSRLLVLLFAMAVCVSFGATQSMYTRSAATAPSGPGASSIGGRVAVDRTCPLASLNPLVFDVSETPEALDPAVTFSFGGWAAVPQVYQTLVQYNGSSPTGITGLLSASWTISPDRINYTFHLRTGIHFSNGDPLNAYGMWFSLNRALVMNQAPAFILQQNFWFPGLNYYSNPNASASASAWMAHVLNTYDFVAPSAAELAVMKALNQSFQVVDAQTITLRVGAGYLGAGPYTYLLATLADPIASAVDPVVVQANGGVLDGSINPWMEIHMVGTGPYVLSSFDLTTGYSLAPDPNYWGTGAARNEPWNVALQPARASVQIQFQTNVTAQVSDLKLGAVAGIPSELLDVPTLNQVRANPCVVTKIMDPVYGSAFGGWWVYMSQNVPPFNNLSVRRAVAHAIDVGRIINLAFGGYAQPWVGPVPLGYPYANPQAVPPYSFDLALARSSMNASPWPLPAGYPFTINFEYVNIGSWATVATLLTDDLAKIGIHLNPVGINYDQLFTLEVPDANGVCTSETSYAGGPFPIGMEYFSADYLAPDDWTQNDALSYGSANMCMAQYANATVDALVLDAARQSNPAILTQDYAEMTRIMYANVSDVWLAVPDQVQVHHPSLRGIIPNPMGSAPEFALTLNTMYAVPPIVATANVTPAPVTVNQTVTLRAGVSGGTPPYSVRWEFGDGGSVTGGSENATHVYAAAANYTANVTVRDSYGGYATASVRVVVEAAPAPPPPPPPPPPPTSTSPLVYVGVAGIAIVAVAVVVFVLLWRRRKPEPPGPPAAPPSPPPPT